MNRSDLIHALHITGAYLSQHAHKQPSDSPETKSLNAQFYDEMEALIASEHIYNPWFTESNIRKAMGALSQAMGKEDLSRWVSSYPELPVDARASKTVGVVMAGNIPLVGFHDMMSVLMSGHRFLGKPSSKDERLMKKVGDLIISIEPALSGHLAFTSDYLTKAEAIIATGSDNASRYFEYYFKHIPHIIRKNRNGVAVLNGEESDSELNAIAEDIFAYFGLGCRNVTKLFLPEDFELERLMKTFDSFSFLAEHHKYMNNVSYYRTVYLMNGQQFLDNNIVLLKEDQQIASPIGVVYYEKYLQLDDVIQRLISDKELIQCIVSSDDNLKEKVVPGRSQYPELWEYADGVDTMKFLAGLS